MTSIVLSEEQQKKLSELSKIAPELITHRARLILAYAAGKPTLLAASEAGISRGRARFWKRQFISRGMDIFNIDSSRSQEFQGSLSTQAEEVTGAPLLPFSNDASKVDLNPHPEIPYPQPRQSIGIQPDDSLAQAGRKVWLYHFALMLSHEEGTLAGAEIEELHDMRVATRRMRTAFDIFGQAFEPKIIKPFLKGLRKIGRALGEVRDMDVLLHNAIVYQRSLEEADQPGLEPLLTAWMQVIQKKRSKMIKILQAEEYKKFKSQFNFFLQAPDVIKSKVENTLMNSSMRDNVPVLIYSRYAAVRAYEPILPSASITQLHALRIEFKKFRYVLEYFREILGKDIGRAISELKQMQDHLGELHDADVACLLVKDFLAGWEQQQLMKPIPERQNPEPIVTYLAFLHARRYQLMGSFPESWRRFSRPEFRQVIAQAVSLL